jgi:hypothetical protein
MSPELEAARKKLEELNTAIDLAVQARTRHLDECMALVAPFAVGDVVYNCITGCKGVVTEHYRIHQGNAEFDTRISGNCKIQEPVGGSTYDNTSRYNDAHPWVLYEDYENRTDKYIRKVESCARMNSHQ